MTESAPERSHSAARWLSNGPWRSRSVAIATLLTLVGIFFWFSEVRRGKPQQDSVTTTPNSAEASEPALNSHSQKWDWEKPFPAYAKLSASFVVGSCVGWFFRRLSRLVFVMCAMVLALLAVGKFAGLETERVRDEVRQGAEWTESTIESAKSFVKFAMPSAAGFAIGMFMGFRRRRHEP